ncbi:hypothetical protein PoB_002672700 [Plakobranchus ocellatus]|uniref:Uncharacterized protein n=1 Tax=Plakobranchus ocellatus TaxID=259542 RepID=A0AAV4A053_9GAST|nr:hypothetical protein PoB_002672700 [Plakobranchus ocellatus]
MPDHLSCLLYAPCLVTYDLVLLLLCLPPVSTDHVWTPHCGLARTLHSRCLARDMYICTSKSPKTSLGHVFLHIVMFDVLNCSSPQQSQASGESSCLRSSESWGIIPLMSELGSIMRDLGATRRPSLTRPLRPLISVDRQQDHCHVYTGSTDCGRQRSEFTERALFRDASKLIWTPKHDKGKVIKVMRVFFPLAFRGRPYTCPVCVQQMVAFLNPATRSDVSIDLLLFPAGAD